MTLRPGSSFVTVAAALTLSACVTAKLHSQEEVAAVGQRCGLALGELFQDDSEKKLLFLLKIQPTAEQRVCVNRWARKNHLKTVFVDTITFAED